MDTRHNPNYRRIVSARVFDLACITEQPFTPNGDDCLLLGVNTFGGAVAVVAKHDSPALLHLREEMERSERGIVSVISLRGFAVTERSALDEIAEQSGRQPEIALRGIHSVFYYDSEQNRVTVRVSKQGNKRVSVEPRREVVVYDRFYCVSCRNAGRRDCHRQVEQGLMEEVTVNGRLMTFADCPKCGKLMCRTGGIRVRRERHAGLSERRLFYELPEGAYCFSCRGEVKILWGVSARRSDSQPCPHHRGSCISCLEFVGAPWTRTKLVPIKNKTLEKLRSAVETAQQKLQEERYAEGMAVLRRRFQKTQ